MVAAENENITINWPNALGVQWEIGGRTERMQRDYYKFGCKLLSIYTNRTTAATCKNSINIFDSFLANYDEIIDWHYSVVVQFYLLIISSHTAK